MSAPAVPTPPRNPPRNPPAHHRKGEIWHVVEDPSQPPVGTEMWPNRPALVVSADLMNKRSGFAMVVYLSRSGNKRITPTHVPLPCVDGPESATTMALCEQVHTVDASRLVECMGKVGPEQLREVDAAIAFAMSLGRNPDTYGLFKKWENHVKNLGVDVKDWLEALQGRTTDERAQALTRALALTTSQLEAYKKIVETSQELPAALQEVEQVLARNEED